MKNTKAYIVLIILCLNASCVIDYKSTTTFKLKNTTGHKIELISFSKGVRDTARSFDLAKYSEHITGVYASPGKSKASFVLPPYFYGLDSVQVLWDEQYLVTYLGGPFTTNNKNIPYNDSTENFLQLNSYEQNLVKDARKYSHWEIIFKFMEEDYEFAKQ